MQTVDVTGEVLGTPNAEMRRNLTGYVARLFEPWQSAAGDQRPTD